ncbi:MAG: HlyC/CorC family transporter [Clostridiales bacterium]|nr:HlyC/CorC family transporter [Clostridiales bacterium]
MVNAFFAMTEIAVLSLNEVKIKRLADDGDKKAIKKLRLLSEPAAFLSTIQIGITLAGFLGSAFAADNFAKRLEGWIVSVTGASQDVVHTVSVIIITLILSYFTLVLGELVPKRIAMKKPDAVANYIVSLITFLSVILRPVVWLLSVSTNGVLRLLGINPKDVDEQITEEEIRMMVDIGEEKGTIETNEREMIENIFEFNNTYAYDVMTHRTDMTVISIDEREEEIIKTIIESGVSRIPVYEEDIDNIIGILSVRKYLLNLRGKNPLPLRDIIQPAYLVPDSVRADVLFRDMQRKKAHMAIVLDEYGGTSGLVTMEDLLEQIVGNIYDEFDPLAEQEIVMVEENLWKVSGSLDLDVLAEVLGVTFDEDLDIDTVGGMVFSRLSEIPPDGSTPEVDFGPLHIKVIKICDRRVESAFVSKIISVDEKESGSSSENGNKK